MKAYILCALLVVLAVNAEANAQSRSAGRNIHYAAVFINTDGSALRTFDGGLSWKSISAEESEFYQSKSSALNAATSTASVTPKLEVAVTVFPNPTKERITISSDELLNSAGSIRIFDTRGIEVLSQDLASGLRTREIDVRSLLNGHYNFVCLVGGKSGTGSILVQR